MKACTIPNVQKKSEKSKGSKVGDFYIGMFGASFLRYEEWKAAGFAGLNPDGCRDAAWQSARALGQESVELLAEVEKELASWAWTP